MIIALDAMGGDRAPLINVEGAIMAAKEVDATIVLVGDKDILEPLLKEHKKESLKGSVVIVHAPEVVAMSESPAVAVRKKKKVIYSGCS